MPTLAAWILLLLYLAFTLPTWKKWLQHLHHKTKGWIVIFLLVPYYLAVKGHLIWQDLICLILYITLPTLLLHRQSQQVDRSQWAKLGAVLLLWIPIEPDLFLGILQLLSNQTWTANISTPNLLPTIEVSLLGSLAWVPCPISTLIGLNLALFLFLVAHPLPNIGFTTHLTRYDFKQALTGFASFSLIALPMGLSIDFLVWQPQWPGIFTLLEWSVLGYLLVALVEEFLFRGLIQNLLRSVTQNKMISLVPAAFIFGVSHLNNATPRFTEPNWGYLLMGSLAGLAYGWVWLRTGKVTASALTHMLVNLTWRLLLQ